jgi:hypothetical protein
VGEQVTRVGIIGAPATELMSSDVRADGALGFYVLDVLESLLEAAVEEQPVEVGSTVERPAAVPPGASPDLA